MRNRRCVIALFVLLLCAAASLGFAADAPAVAQTAAVSQHQQRDGYDYYQIGDTAARRRQALKPGLLLAGGGDWHHDAFHWFARQAGHGHVLVLRASGGANLQEELFNDIGGLASVQTLVFHSRVPASDPVVLDMVRKADAIFLSGGDQSKYVRFWKGTPLNDALNAHLRAGKPLGGTSAGLAIMGAYAYSPIDDRSLQSDQALRDPMSAEVNLVAGFLQAPQLAPGRLITDTHFSQRARLGRLLAMLTRVGNEAGTKNLYGLGVDEDTMLTIDGDGQGRLYSLLRDGWAWLVTPLDIGRGEAGRPMHGSRWKLTAIGPDSILRLPDYRVINPVQQATASVEDGKLTVSLDHSSAPSPSTRKLDPSGETP